MLAIVFASFTHAQTLGDAYRNELSRLDEEQVALRSALEAAKSKRQSARAALVNEIEILSSQLIRLRADNNSQELQLPQTARLQSLQEQERNVDRRARQIETWLETHGITLSTVPPDGAGNEGNHEHPPLELMVKAALEHVEEHGQLWLRTDQEYFGADGVAKAGPVLRIAEVGAVTTMPDFQPLSLALDGSLRVIGGQHQPSVVLGGIRTVDVVLFDPSDIRRSKTEVEGLYDWIDQGGVVMWVIGLLAVFALLIFLERIIAYTRYFFRLWAAERKGLAVALPQGDRLLNAVVVVQKGKGSADEIETQAAYAISQTQPFIRRGVSLLAVVASVAPLLGLLGTVTGMIGTFAMITEYGTGDPRLLSGGISEALLTTQFGLMVAIPALLFQTTLYRCGDALLRRIESLALKTLESRFANIQAAGAGADHVAAARSA